MSSIVGQVASALDAAHARGLVHRDVKRTNGLLTPDDHAYVSDFGLTKRAVSVSGLTETGQLVGTIDYIAPEQIKWACSLPARHRSGRAPGHVETAPPSLTEERPDLPSEVDEVVAFAKDPAARMAAAGDVAAGFRSALGLEAPQRGRPVPARKKRKPKISRRRTLIAAVVAGVVLIAGVGTFLLGGGGDEVVASAPNSVAMIDSTTNAFEVAVRVGEDLTGIAVGEDGELWVINQGNSTVNRIDRETGEVSPAESTLGIPTGRLRARRRLLLRPVREPTGARPDRARTRLRVGGRPVP